MVKEEIKKLISFYLVCKRTFIHNGVKYIEGDRCGVVGIPGKTNVYIISPNVNDSDFNDGIYGVWFTTTSHRTLPLFEIFYIWDYFETITESRRRKLKNLP